MAYVLIDIFSKYWIFSLISFIPCFIYLFWNICILCLVNLIYKITKIVRALWFAERSVAGEFVNMVVASWCFAFRALITQARIWKKVLKFKTRQVYFIYPFLRWLKLGKSLQGKYVDFFFRLSWQLKREKSVFWKASFCKTRTDYACKTSWTRLCDWWEFLF